MGITRKIKKNMGICIARTGVKFSDCDVVLMVSSPAQGKKVAEAFRQYMNFSARRSSLPNLHDIYNATLVMQKRVSKGESIFN